MPEFHSLEGIIDLHLHTAPDLYPRSLDDLEVVETGVKEKMRAAVIKSHHFPTMARAELMNRLKDQKYGNSSDFTVYGSISLNESIGGINREAVQAALDLGAKIVYLPTNTAENHRLKEWKTGGVICTQNGKAVPELREIFRLIKEYNVILATGHVSPKECFILVEEARSLGVKKIVITHPEFHIVGMSLEDQIRLIKDYDVMIEREYSQPINGIFYPNWEQNCTAIHECGYKNTILATDGGQKQNPNWHKMLNEMISFYLQAGFTKEQLDTMMKSNPAKLLGI